MSSHPTSVLSFVDRALAKRIEAVEVAQHRAAVRRLVEGAPALRAEALDLGGGVAAFCGGSVPISRAVGMGLDGPVEASEIDALEALYRSRACPATVLLSPFADESLFALLGERGFRLDELDTMLACPLDEAAPSPPTRPGITVEVTPPERARAWVERSIESFSGSSSAVPEGNVAIYEQLFPDPAATYLEARCEGHLAGTAAMYVHDRTVYFFATSTAPASRGRGVQAALIEARLSLSREAGCTLAWSRTAPGSTSQRNLERAGFRAIYSRAIMRKRFV